MKKLNQKAFSEQISEYTLKELSFCLGHLFLAIIKRESSADDVSYLKHWCSQTIDSAVRFHKKQLKKRQ
jgi:hypothetical protein